MTGVPRLQHLPVPVASAGALAVAAPTAPGGQKVKAVQPVDPGRRYQAGAERGAAWSRDAGGEAVDDGAGRSATAGQIAGEAAAGKLIGFSRLASMPFMVQLLGQQHAAGRSQAALPQTGLTGHRDAAQMGSELYRRSGGEPEILPDGATFVRLAV